MVRADASTSRRQSSVTASTLSHSRRTLVAMALAVRQHVEHPRSGQTVPEHTQPLTFAGEQQLASAHPFPVRLTPSHLLR